MSRRVAVIGGGASGTAAAYAASRLGARVTVILGRPGATSLSSGAVDGDVGAVTDEVRAFAGALGIWEIGACRVATGAGLLRKAAGRDRAVLDLENIQPGVVGVVDVPRRGWDANGLAESLSREPWAIERGLHFERVVVDSLLRADEELIPLADLAALHDDPERVGWLADRLRESASLRSERAILVGPWLGLRPGVASDLARSLGKPVGEPLSMPGGAPGLRFERARDQLLAKLGIAIVDDWAASLEIDEASARIELATGASHQADAVVIALGGLAAGGVEWSPVTESCGFTTSLRQPGTLASNGRPLPKSGSLEGALFEKFSWPGGSARSGIERVGVWTEGNGRVRREDGSTVDRLYAAGDVVADAPRTILFSVQSGLDVGAIAAR